MKAYRIDYKEMKRLLICKRARQFSNKLFSSS